MVRDIFLCPAEARMYRLCHEGCHGPLFCLSRVCASFVARSRQRESKAMAMKHLKTESILAAAAAMHGKAAVLRLPHTSKKLFTEVPPGKPGRQPAPETGLPKKMPRRQAALKGMWIMTGCYYRKGDRWILDADYFQAPYYEVWEFRNDGTMTHRSYDIELDYRYILSGSVLIASPATDIPNAAGPDMYRVRASKKHAVLVLFSPVPAGIERRFELRRMPGQDNPLPPKSASHSIAVEP